MLAIFRRDFRSYFTSPIGYIFCGVFIFGFNMLFYFYNLQTQLADMSNMFAIMLIICMILVPLLTMRILSEDFKQKTDQLLLTAPVKLYGIVVGKFLAVMCVFAIAILVTFICPLIIAVFGTPLVGAIVGNYVAFICTVSAIMSIGVFVSSLTESQVISAIITWGIFVALILLEIFSGLIPISWIRAAVNWISIIGRYSDFASGVFAVDSIIFYISLCAIFLFLTIRVLEKKRWS